MEHHQMYSNYYLDDPPAPPPENWWAMVHYKNLHSSEAIDSYDFDSIAPPAEFRPEEGPAVPINQASSYTLAELNRFPWYIVVAAATSVFFLLMTILTLMCIVKKEDVVRDIGTRFGFFKKHYSN